MEHIIQPITTSLHIQPEQTKSTLQLLEEGSTVSLTTRYRKEVTKGLDEEQIRVIQEQYEYQVNLEKREEDVKCLVEQQGKLTEEVSASVNACEKLSQVEDTYRPYQQKRKIRASDAAARGLKPFAEWMLKLLRDADVRQEVKRYLNDKVPDVEVAIQGAKDIIAEMASDDPAVRQKIHGSVERYGRLTTKEKKKHTDEKEVHRMYYDYSERVITLASHHITAIGRGEKEKVLAVSIEFDKEYIIDWTNRRFTKERQSPCVEYIEEAVQGGLKRLAFPAVERKIRSQLNEKAHEQSIEVFSLNLERPLMQSPAKSKMVLGFDPISRTGCRLAVVDKNGNMLDVSVIHPTLPNAKIKEAKEKMLQLLKKYPTDIIAIGNGTASRESEAFVAALIREYHPSAAYIIVSGAGTSVYFASKLAREEFPNLHVEQCSAVSIARKIIDPLSELIKIDPQSIGVGQHQHDPPTVRLKDRPDFVISKAVSRVGVNVNTASQELLKNMPGPSQATAKPIVEYRREHGELKNRKELKKIPKIGTKSYGQMAGLLCTEDEDELLDRTGTRPESYATARKVLQQPGLSEQDMGSEQAQEAVQQTDIDGLIRDYESDRYTIQDILEAIATPLRDYRERYDAPLLRSGVPELEDLHIGDQLEGVVRSVVDFGALMDIGLHEDGLVHISKTSRHRITHPSDKVSVGDIVKVWTYNVDEEKQKVQLLLLLM